MSNNMKKYDVEATLFFFYFGLTPDEFEDESRGECLLNKVVNKALFDATMQGAFNAKVLEEDKNKAKIAKQNAVDYLVNRIKKLESVETKEEYDEWHHETCIGVQCEFKEIKEDEKPIFSYGNAQKIVNMSIKYLYMLNGTQLAIRGNKVLENVKDRELFLHVPIDSYIIDQLYINKIINENSECDGTKMMPLLKRENKELPKTKYLKDCSHPSEYIKPWSQWDYNVYEKVQKKIKDNKPNGYDNLLDWENDLWIERVKKLRA